jgi:putative ABC transport system substrate-binding protein
MKRLLAELRPFLAAIALIIAIAAVLVYSDGAGRRTDTPTQRLPHVAIIQHASQAALDDGVAGIIAGLAAHGYVDGQSVVLQKFNAQGDLATANDIAHQATAGSFDLVITASTVSMQSVANVNQQSKVRHIFGVVTDAARTGVGVGPGPLDHPAYMAGYNVLVPVDRAIKLALRMNPALKRLGLVWHTAEANSKIYADATRAACAALGLTLLEANADGASAVGEAAASLAARGVDAFLVTGDVVVLVGVDALIRVADRAGVPVFSVVPPNSKKGAIFDIGADYRSIGMDVGNLAAEVLGGRDLATVAIENRVPPMFVLNELALGRFAPKWRLPADLREQADVVIDKDGEHHPKTP